MSRHITDDQMRSLWKRRCQARETIASNHKPIHDHTHEERKQMARCDREIYWATKGLEKGLSQRHGRFEVEPGTFILLDTHSELVPVWGWMWTSADSRTRNLAAARMERREAVAC